VRTPGTQGSERPSLGVRLPFRVLRVFAARAPSPPRPPKRPERSVSSGSASQASCSHERDYAGCPFFRLTSPRLRVAGEGYRAPAGAVLRVLAPLDGSGCARGTHVHCPHLAVVAATPFAVAPRRFAALVHAARVPGVALQSVPLSRSRTRSRGPRASMRVRVRPPNGAARSEGFATPFPGAPTSRRGLPEGSPDWKAGTTVPWSR
jgi:hypothetical protein